MEVTEAFIGDHDESSEATGGGRLLKIEPLELRFTFEPKKQISCCIYLSNLTDNPAAFRILTNNVTNYVVRPNSGIILPRTTCGITVTMQAQNENAPASEFKDKFKIQSVLVSLREDVTCISTNVFNQEEGSVEEYRLPVVYLSAALPLLPESRKANNLLSDNKKLTSSQLINVQPAELKFPFEVNKQISTSLQLSNMTQNYVAFKVMTTHPKNFCVRPNRGVMVPQSTSDITVTMQAKKAPPDAQGKYKFLIRSAVVCPSTAEKDINWKKFDKEGPVEDIKLSAIHTSTPKAAFPVAEMSEDFSSERAAFLMPNDSSNISQLSIHTSTRKTASPVAETSEESSSKGAFLMQHDSSNFSQEISRHDSEMNLQGSNFTSIFGRIFDTIGLTSSPRSYDQYKKLR